MSAVNRPVEPGARMARLVLVPEIYLYAHLKHLLSVLGSRGPIFQRYLLNGRIDQDETWAEEVLVCDLNFHKITI